MEGGRPPIDPDDLDFDFETPRRRQSERETGERPIGAGREDDEASSREDAAEPPSEENRYETGESSAAGADDDPFDTGERRARRREDRKQRFRLPSFRRERQERRERHEREAAADPPPGLPAGTDTSERRLRDDPYTPAVVPVPGSRRSRRSDLPAKIRRRQAGLAGLAVVAVLVGIVLLARAVFGGGGDDDDEPLPLKKLVGQTVIGKLGKAGPDDELLRRVRKGQLGGVIVTPQNEQALAQQVAQLQQAASEGDNPQLLVMIDQEGGDVKRLPGPPTLSPKEIGDAGADTARTEGEDTANYLKGPGVNVDLAPVMDVEEVQTADTIASRTFSDDPAVVSEVGSAFIEGMQDAAVAATAKHFPGLGPATVNTDFAPTEIVARQETLDAGLIPFQSAIEAGVELVMVASASYPGYAPDDATENRPASSVSAITQGLLRDRLGFQGLVITDDLESIAIETLSTPSAAGIAALNAGCDLILYGRSAGASVDAFNAVVKAAKQEKVSRDQLQASYNRITSLKSRLASAAAG